MHDLTGCEFPPPELNRKLLDAWRSPRDRHLNMNNYHIYEEIGRGKYSVVYKVSPRQGRRKKTIEYVAVKSVEKSRRKKVLNEVRGT